MSKLFGLQINGEWFISHMESEKEVWEEVENYYQPKYPHIDFKRGVVVMHSPDLRW